MKPATLLLTVLIVYMGALLFIHRGLYGQPLDPAYWQQKYEQSQWRLPLSRRTLGDSGLYLVLGLDLMRGADPSLASPEVPPLGKYAIGAIASLTQNAYLYGFAATLFLLVCSYVFAKTATGSTSISLIITALFAIDPLLTDQWTLTMLDSLQAAIFLLFLSVALVLKKQRTPSGVYFWSGVAGVLLGMFCGIKIPLFAVILCGVVIGILFSKKRTAWPASAVFLLSAGVFLLLPYFRYFALGHSLREWLGLQKTIVLFYLDSGLKANMGSALTTLFTGYYRNLFTHAWTLTPQWSLAWPVASLIWLSGHRSAKVRDDGTWKLISIVCGLMLLLESVIPFWSRYLLIVLPLLYTGMAIAVRRIASPMQRAAIIMTLAFVNLVPSAAQLIPTPKALVDQTMYEWHHGFFSDIYEHADASTKRDASRDAFDRTGKTLFYDAEIESVAIRDMGNAWSRWQSPQTNRISVTYHTRRLGSFTLERPITVVKERGQWKIRWSWDTVFDGATEKTEAVTEVQPAKRGAIINEHGEVVAADLPGYEVWVTPSGVKQTEEDALLTAISTHLATRLPAVRIHDRYVDNTLPDRSIPIGVLSADVTTQDLQRISGFAGVDIRPALVRWHDRSVQNLGEMTNTQFDECCSFFYSTTTYDGNGGLEGTYNGALKGKNGGSLTLRQADGRVIRTLLSVKRIDGADVRLE